MRKINVFGDKKAEAGWTLRKVVALLLGAIILVLLIFGVVSGQLKPLAEKVEGMIDSVLIMFGIRDNDANYGERTCVTYSLDSLEGGVDFIKSLEKDFPPEQRRDTLLFLTDVEYKICSDASCRLLFKKDGMEYSYDGGNSFYSKGINSNKWVDQSSYVASKQSSVDNVFYSGFYQGGLNGIYKHLGIVDVLDVFRFDTLVEKYSNGKKAGIVIYNKVEGSNEEVVLRWSSSSIGWTYFVDGDEKEKDIIPKNNFRKFYEIVHGGDDDEVYYYDYFDAKKSDDEDVGHLIGSGSNELNNEKELDKFYNEVVKLQNDIKIKNMKGTTSNLKEKLDGKEIVMYDGSTWTLSVEVHGDLPMIILTSKDGKKYGFRFEEFFSDRGLIIQDLLVLGVIENDKWSRVGDPLDYRSPGSYPEGFNSDVLISSRIYSFLKGHCDLKFVFDN